MTIDPQVAGLLDMLKAQGVPPFSEMTVEAARGFVGAFLDLEGPEEAVAEVRNLTIDGPGGDLALRVYRPVESDDRPVIVYFHGGGYVLCDLTIADKPARQLANVTGCVVVSVDYRLAPEAKAPSAADDCYAATLWVSQNGPAVGGDVSRLAVNGDSAGGSLAAAVTQMARDKGGPEIALQVLFYPMTDFGGEYESRDTNAEGYLLTKVDLGWFGGHYLNTPADADNPYVSPIRGDLTGLPPAVVVTAGYDPLRSEGDAYADKLKAAGVETLHLPNPSMIHGFMWMSGVCDHTATVYAQVGEHVREALKV